MQSSSKALSLLIISVIGISYLILDSHIAKSDFTSLKKHRNQFRSDTFYRIKEAQGQNICFCQSINQPNLFFFKRCLTFGIQLLRLIHYDNKYLIEVFPNNHYLSAEVKNSSEFELSRQNKYILHSAPEPNLLWSIEEINSSKADLSKLPEDREYIIRNSAFAESRVTLAHIAGSRRAGLELDALEPQTFKFDEY